MSAVGPFSKKMSLLPVAEALEYWQVAADMRSSNGTSSLILGLLNSIISIACEMRLSVRVKESRYDDLIPEFA